MSSCSVESRCIASSPSSATNTLCPSSCRPPRTNSAVSVSSSATSILMPLSLARGVQGPPEAVAVTGAAAAQRPQRQRINRSIGVWPLSIVLEHLAGARINSDFEGLPVVLDVKGIAQTCAAAFLFEFLVGDHAGMCTNGCLPCLCKRDLRLGKQLGPGEMTRRGSSGGRRTQESGRGNDDFQHCFLQ